MKLSIKAYRSCSSGIKGHTRDASKLRRLSYELPGHLCSIGLLPAIPAAQAALLLPCRCTRNSERSPERQGNACCNMPAMAQGIYRAIKEDLDPIVALQISSLNAARWPSGWFLSSWEDPWRMIEDLIAIWIALWCLRFGVLDNAGKCFMEPPLNSKR